MTPQRDGGIHKTPKLNKLSRDKVIVSKAADDIVMEDSRTQSSSIADTDEFFSTQGSSTSESNQSI